MNKQDLAKVGKGALLAALGAGLVYGLEGLNAINFGQYDMAVAAVVSVLLNLARKLIATQAVK